MSNGDVVYRFEARFVTNCLQLENIYVEKTDVCGLDKFRKKAR